MTAGLHFLCRVVADSIEVLAWHLDCTSVSADTWHHPPEVRVETSPSGLYLWVTLLMPLWTVHQSVSLAKLADEADRVIEVRLRSDAEAVAA